MANLDCQFKLMLGRYGLKKRKKRPPPLACCTLVVEVGLVFSQSKEPIYFVAMENHFENVLALLDLYDSGPSG